MMASIEFTDESIKDDCDDIVILIEELNRLENECSEPNHQHVCPLKGAAQSDAKHDRQSNGEPTQSIRLKAGDSGSREFKFDFTYHDQFASKETRMKFIRKVYFILTIMLGIVFIPVILVQTQPEIHDLFKKYYWAFSIPSLFMYLVCFYSLTCYEIVRRHVPTNFIVLILFSTFLGILLGCISLRFKGKIIMLALSYTFALTLTITILAVCCPIDLTKFGILITVVGLILIIFSIIVGIVLRSVYHEYRLADLICGGIGLVVFSIYLAVDTQLILGGKQHEISPEEYIFAVVILLTDIVNLFLSILQLMSGADD